jgi:hypothetical protein
MVIHDATATGLATSTFPDTSPHVLVDYANVGLAGLGIGADINISTLPRINSQNTGHALDGSPIGTTATLGLDPARPSMFLDGFCPHAGFSGFTLPNVAGDKVDLFLPKLWIFRKETLRWLGRVRDLGVPGFDTDGDGVLEDDWDIFSITGLLCDNVATNFVALGKRYTGSYHGTTITNQVRPYETDIKWVCGNFGDKVPAYAVPPIVQDTNPKWFCWPGGLGEGVLGFALRSEPPVTSVPPGCDSTCQETLRQNRRVPGSRIFLARSLRWADMTWDAYFVPGILPVITRTPDYSLKSMGNIAGPFYWNLNPNDLADPLEGILRLHAALAVKYTTNRSGISIEVYSNTKTPQTDGELNMCEELITDNNAFPSALPAVPCGLFADCPAGDTSGVDRTCGWVNDDVYKCTPGEWVSVSMGAPAKTGSGLTDCGPVLGVDGGDNMLRICKVDPGTMEVRGCAPGDLAFVAQNDDACGSKAPSVGFTCPDSGISDGGGGTFGVFSVMKATRDSSLTRNRRFDLSGGGVKGWVGVSRNASAGNLPVTVTPRVTDTCPPGTPDGEARDCGFLSVNLGSWECTPGQAVTFGSIDPATCNSPVYLTNTGFAPVGDGIVRICDGRTACTWNSPRRIGHNDDACPANPAPGVTFICGVSGVFTAMAASYTVGATPPNFGEMGVIRTPTNGVKDPINIDIKQTIDVASTGAFENGVFFEEAVAPNRGLRTCDWATNWGIPLVEQQTLSLGCDAHKMEKYGFRVAANFDANSTWTRCPSYEPPVDASCQPGDQRSVYITLRGMDSATPKYSYLVPYSGATFHPNTGMVDHFGPLLPIPPYTSGGTESFDCAPGLDCCRVPSFNQSMGETQPQTQCRFTTQCGEGITFRPWGGASFASATPDIIEGWSNQFAVDSIILSTGATVVFNHDQAVIVDSNASHVQPGNFICQTSGGETYATSGGDCPVPPDCILPLNGVCDPGETPLGCPHDCHANPAMPSLDTPYASIPAALIPVPAPTPTTTDGTAPVVTVPGNVVADATSSRGAIVYFDVSANDPISGSPAVGDGPVPAYCIPSSGSVFPKGLTTVHCFAEDRAGNVGHSFFQVRVVAIRLKVPADFSVTSCGGGNPHVYYNADAVRTYVDTADELENACSATAPPREGAIEPAVTVTCAPASGTVFSAGTTTTVGCSAYDDTVPSYIVTGSFKVTVDYSGLPTLLLPPDTLAEATSSAGAAVTFASPTASDCSGSVAVTCSRSSGSVFGLGTTTVTCSATNSSGTTSGSFIVQVRDTSAPVLSLPSSVSAPATGPGGAMVAYSATASDAVDGSLSVVCSPPSGFLFPLGTTNVKCSVTDSHGNAATGNFNVTVLNPTPPTVGVPADITRECAGPSGAVVTFSATASDVIDGALTPTCTPVSGATFPITTAIVTCSATDSSSLTGNASFHVTVQDTTSPSITCPANVTAECTGASLATGVSAGAASATDLCSASVSISDPAVGTYPLGTTSVSHTATDAHGLTASCSNQVKVVDTTSPTFVTSTLGPQTVLGSCGSGNVSFTLPSATDSCQGVTVTCGTVAANSYGAHTVGCTATDGSGNSATASITVNVLQPLRVAFQSPLADDNVADNIATDADVSNVFTVGSTIPHKVNLYTCDNTDVTSSAAVTVKITESLRTSDSSPPTTSFVPSYVGAGDSGGTMVLNGGHYQYNVKTDSADFPSGTVNNAYYFDSIITVRDSATSIILGQEDAHLESR